MKYTIIDTYLNNLGQARQRSFVRDFDTIAQAGAYAEDLADANLTPYRVPVAVTIIARDSGAKFTWTAHRRLDGKRHAVNPVTLVNARQAAADPAPADYHVIGTSDLFSGIDLVATVTGRDQAEHLARQALADRELDTVTVIEAANGRQVLELTADDLDL